jgi:hypothetical protein
MFSCGLKRVLPEPPAIKIEPPVKTRCCDYWTTPSEYPVAYSVERGAVCCSNCGAIYTHKAKGASGETSI